MSDDDATSAPATLKLLRHPADRRSLGMVALYYALLACALSLSHPSVATTVLLTAALACISWVCAVIAHNTLHFPIFRARRLNRAFQVALSCAYGFPVSEFLPGHNLSHHRHLQRPADLMRTAKAPFVRVNALNLLWFFPRVALEIAVENQRYAQSARLRRPAWHRQLWLEIGFVWGSKLLLFALDWRKALCFVLLPHLWALWGITTVNFLQHDGCDERHPVDHSRNFVGRSFNWLTFNSGFHGAHHDEPGLHWSELRAAHAERFHGRVHPALEQPSLALWLLRTFVLAPRRARYDGSPFISGDDAGDADWLKAPATAAPRIQELVS